MRRVILLFIALVALVYARASTADTVPIWGFWWWTWIISTVVVAACVGWVANEEKHHRRH